MKGHLVDLVSQRDLRGRPPAARSVKDALG